MTPTTKLFYEVDLNELNQLQTGTQVLKQGVHGGYFVQQIGLDFSLSPGARYFLFKEPSLPAVQLTSR